ncbi:hypothetical protein EYF80_058130 [Liparis tanakae]|uniref:Uncharacterized protein n=1 Tax=Liparis tanakae TaxID=230148 RepID=A0A4Z2ESF6_9TELE|nr:hypothetical protein EYF80_058130 [Liparis tanakae]
MTRLPTPYWTPVREGRGPVREGRGQRRLRPAPTASPPATGPWRPSPARWRRRRTSPRCPRGSSPSGHVTFTSTNQRGRTAATPPGLRGRTRSSRTN